MPLQAGTFLSHFLTSLNLLSFQISKDSPERVVALPSMKISISMFEFFAALINFATLY